MIITASGTSGPTNFSSLGDQCVLTKLFKVIAAMYLRLIIELKQNYKLFIF